MAKYGAYMGIGLVKEGAGQQQSHSGTGTKSSLSASVAQPLSSVSPGGVLGMDVSGWQTSDAAHSISDVDWTDQWRMGARFVYIKATEGTSFRDASFSSQYVGASSVGMLRGGYHFARPDQSDGATQADFFTSNGGGWSADGKTMPPLLDIENNPYGAECYGLSASQIVSWISAFSKEVQARTGRLPMIYTNYYWWQDCTGNSAAFTNQPLHIAAYGTSSPWIPGGWPNYSVWQYSSSGPFAGDSNTWNGTQTSLNTFATNADSPAPPPASPLVNPSIVSTADMVAADSTGALWDYPSNGAGGLEPRKQIGQGWTGMRSITVIDWNSDGVLDLLAQKTTGSLSVYPGLPGGGFGAPQTLASSGWGGYQLTVGYWLNSAPYPQILTRSDSGVLTLWKNPSGGGIDAGTQIGQGWNSLNLTMVDFDGDGNQDLLAQDTTGTVRLYRSNGAGGFMAETRKTVATGWNAFTSVTVYSGFAFPGSTGLIQRNTSGGIRYVPVPGNSSFGTPSALGSGWNPYLIAGGENINTSLPATPDPSIKSVSDVVTVDAAGNLWRYPVANAGLGAGTQIGYGFTGIKSIHVTDWNADGTLDLLVQRTDGRLLLYPGASGGGFTGVLTLAGSGWAGYDMTVGQWIRGGRFPSIVAQAANGSLTSFTTTNGTSLSAGTAVAQGMTRMHPVMTDFDGDGNADIVAVDNIGRLILYRSNGAGQLIAETRPVIGTGWNGMTSVGPANGFTSSGSTGLLAKTGSGNMMYYPTSSSHFGAASTIATGWGANAVAGSQALAGQQALTSPNDVISADANGILWNSAATGTGQLQPPYPIGRGWTGLKSLHVIDWNQDGIPDILAQWSSGTMTVYAGTTGPGFAAPITVGTAGWGNIRITTGKWVSGAPYPGVLGINAAGQMFYWANQSGGTLSAGNQIGTGWGPLRIIMVDFDLDSRADLLAVDGQGLMRLYRSNGSGNFVAETRPVVGSGWAAFQQFSGVTGFTGPGSTGVLADSSDGSVRYYPITAPRSWGAPSILEQTVSGTTISY
ncbi:GH25 family lysozyme [Arthrobacter sp. STN4]|uniref:GH25 family lysozyme n=1 Tax=Arthrobacter sp. STN4 TaxID=2923276 RepID=UPI00211A0A69|nr:GH25 family lysozyme [Arthrobacter sp. STN4]MCQ9163012.1 lysozyme [Arthrobacter sp. STN4]